MDYRVHGILQARILEWAAFPFSRGPSGPRDRARVSLIAGGFFIPAEPQGHNTGFGLTQERWSLMSEEAEGELGPSFQTV